MAWWSRLWRREQKAWGDAELDMIRRIFGAGYESKTGVTVTWQKALEVTTVLRCVRVLADGVATVPLKLMQLDPSGVRAEATEHPVSELLSESPNEIQTSLEFREQLMMHLGLCNNAFVFKSRASNGKLLELLPFEPGKIEVAKQSDGTLRYTATLPGGQRINVPADNMWHMRVAAWNGWMGQETVRLAREAIGLALATEGAHAGLHKNGVQSSGIYSVEGTLNADQHKALVKMLKDQHAGTDNSGLPFILDRNATWKPTAMTGVDAEHVDTRRLQVEEICRAFGVMPIMVGLSDKTATYASSEQMFLAHAVHTVRPWHRRWEASIRKNLLTPAERRGGYYPKFFDSELLRGAAKDRGEFYARALGSGGSEAWATQNEVRGWEDLPPKKGGDELAKRVASPAPSPSTQGA